MSIFDNIEQSTSAAQIRTFDNEIKLLEDQMATIRDYTFFLILFLKDLLGIPVDYELSGKIAALKVGRDLAMKTTKEVSAYINMIHIHWISQTIDLFIQENKSLQ